MSFALETTLFLLGFDTFIIPEKAGFLKDFGLVDRVNLLSVGESQKIPCYELAQIVFS
jgi:hypothetical protein